MAAARKKKSRVFVYGDWGGIGLCVLPLEDAEELAERGDDFSTVETLRDYLEICRRKPKLYAGEAEDIEELADEGRPLDDPVDVWSMPGAGDGYFPPDPRTWMLDRLPEEVFEIEEGTVFDGMGGTPMFYIEKEELPPILEVLVGLGHEVREDQSLFDRMPYG